MIIALVGPAGSGKDTAAQAMVDTFGLSIRRLADPIRMTLALPIWQQALAFADRPDAPRLAAQAIGDAFRALDPALLVRLALAAPVESPGVVIPDVRLPEEAQALRAYPDVRLVYCDTDPAVRAQRLIRRDGEVLSLTTGQHPTEVRVPQLATAADFRWSNTADFATTWPVLARWLEQQGLSRRRA